MQMHGYATWYSVQRWQEVMNEHIQEQGDTSMNDFERFFMLIVKEQWGDATDFYQGYQELQERRLEWGEFEWDEFKT